MTKLQRSYIRIILSAMLALGGAAALYWAMNNPFSVALEYRTSSRAAARLISKLTGFFPFSLAEMLVYAFALFSVFAIIRLIFELIKRPRRLLRLFSFISSALLLIACVITVFLELWGLNYFAPDMAAEMQLPVTARSAQELSEATLWLRDKAGEYAPLVERDENGVTTALDFQELSDRVSAAYKKAAAGNGFFGDTGARAKSVLWAEGMSFLGLTGIYFPFTAECSVNGTQTGADLPFTTAHEFAHRMGVAPENEANFTAYLVLRGSGDNLLCYSAYYSAMCYCINALARVDSSMAMSVYEGMDYGVIADIIAANERYRQYEGPVRDAAESVNNTYLQVMQQPSGVRSYGEVVDLILADYYSQ
ncbi:MAG: DUF3810 domain-containing protein [Oscillospiraceae bacterium]|jgi:hypothetical protein